MLTYQNILFDLDGTLTDPFEGLANSVQYSLKKMGLQEPDRTSIRRFIGPPLIHSYMEFYGLSRTDAERAVAYYREFYTVKGLYQNRVYPGMESLLSALKQADARLFVATSKPQGFAEEVLRHFGLTPYFEHIEGVAIDNCEVEKAVLMQALLQKFLLDKKETAMVGDRKYDIQSANKVGICSIGILHGYGSRAEFEACGAKVIVKDSYALKDYLWKGDMPHA